MEIAVTLNSQPSTFNCFAVSGICRDPVFNAAGLGCIDIFDGRGLFFD